MTPYDLMYYCLQVSLFMNGVLVALALRRAASAGSGAVVALTAVSFVAGIALMLFAPSHVSSLGYRACTVANRFCMGLATVGPLAWTQWRRKKPLSAA